MQLRRHCPRAWQGGGAQAAPGSRHAVSVGRPQGSEEFKYFFSRKMDIFSIPEQLPAGGPPVRLCQIVAEPVDAPVNVVLALNVEVTARCAKTVSPVTGILRLLHEVPDSGDGGLDGLVVGLAGPGDLGQLLDCVHQPGVEGQVLRELVVLDESR